MNKFKVFWWYQLTEMCGFAPGGDSPILENILNTMYSKGYKYINAVCKKEKDYNEGLFIFEII